MRQTQNQWAIAAIPIALFIAASFSGATAYLKTAGKVKRTPVAPATLAPADHLIG
jgi:hypothetical protein